MVYNLNRTVGSRVVSVTVKCADCEVPEYLPLEFNKTYGVVLPKFLAVGGNNYTMFKGYKSIVLEVFLSSIIHTTRHSKGKDVSLKIN